MAPPVAFKAKFGDELRRFTHDVSSGNQLTFDWLLQTVSELFRVPGRKLRVQYKDEDGDLIEISSDNELAEAVRIAQLNKQGLVLIIIAFDESERFVPPAVRASAPYATEQGAASIPTEPASRPAGTSTTASSSTPRPASAIPELPPFLAEMLGAQHTELPAFVANVLGQVTSNPGLLDLASRFWPQGAPYLRTFAENVQLRQAMEASLNGKQQQPSANAAPTPSTSGVKKPVAKAAPTPTPTAAPMPTPAVGKKPAETKNVVESFAPGTSSSTSFVATASSSASASTSSSSQGPPAPTPTPTPAKGDGPSELAVHQNITCDGCGQKPIVGARFKCLDCTDYDLCSACDAKGVHTEHTFVKIRSPSDKVVVADVPFPGLAEGKVATIVTPDLSSAMAESMRAVGAEAGIHMGVRCDVCHMSPIIGTRYWCEQCPDFDLCATCHAAREKVHIKEHTFAAVGPANVVHHGVECDSCHTAPITGARYKCTVCSNYDLCESCQANKVHNADHELRKIDQPMYRPPFERRGCGGGEGWGARHHWGGRHHGMHAAMRQKWGGEKRSCREWSGNACGSGGDIPVGRKYNARFVTDVTIFDGTQVQFGERFTKIWRYRNEGSVAWPEGVHLQVVGGDDLAVQQVVPVPVIVNPGEEIDVSVDMIAPSRPGRFVQHFRLGVGPCKQHFGQKVWAMIEVISPNTTPAESVAAATSTNTTTTTTSASDWPMPSAPPVEEKAAAPEKDETPLQLVTQPAEVAPATLEVKTEETAAATTPEAAAPVTSSMPVMAPVAAQVAPSPVTSVTSDRMYPPVPLIPSPNPWMFPIPASSASSSESSTPRFVPPPPMGLPMPWWGPMPPHYAAEGYPHPPYPSAEGFPHPPPAPWWVQYPPGFGPEAAVMRSEATASPSPSLPLSDMGDVSKDTPLSASLVSDKGGVVLDEASSSSMAASVASEKSVVVPEVPQAVPLQITSATVAPDAQSPVEEASKGVVDDAEGSSSPISNDWVMLGAQAEPLAIPPQATSPAPSTSSITSAPMAAANGPQEPEVEKLLQLFSDMGLTVDKTEVADLMKRYKGRFDAVLNNMLDRASKH